MSDDSVGVPTTYLPAGLPAPVAEADGLSAPFWQGLRERRLLVQRCSECLAFQFGPEWICHVCHALDPAWVEVAARGTIYSWERVWHPSHGALRGFGPYLVVLVEVEGLGGVRMLGNLLGDAMQAVVIGSRVHGVFEGHDEAVVPYTLLQWQVNDTAEHRSSATRSKSTASPS
ncbi:MAG: hypothetical protein JWQ11_2221 [Rhizobacter sp.]|nr:hypothetical protein [Rhizobacter sp.]